MIEITEWARDILHRSQEAAARFNPDVVIRLTRTSAGVEAQLAASPEPTDVPVEVGEMTLHAEAGLEGVLDIEEPHDRLVLKPPGSRPNPREPH